MRRIIAVASVAGVVSLLAALLLAAGAQAEASSTGLTQANERVCGTPAAGRASCFAIRHFGVSAAAHNGGHKPGGESSPPISYGASELQTAYGLTSAAASGGAGRTVAIVDAYDDPNAFADLAHYRLAESLPAIGQCEPSALAGSTTPCFAKVNQSGKAGSYPNGNTGWAEEISLDLDAVSAICPNCNILLVEANTNSLENLGAAVDTAASFGPVAIGNSYGGGEFSTEASFGHYAHPGVAITAATGDSGYGVEFPAAAASVIAVGGTSLRENGGVWSQTVWSGTGSGCSAYVPKPAWQVGGACTRRTVADVAADADPNTGVKVYDTFNEPGEMVFGGTSASTQIVAGVYALAGNGASDASGLYMNGGSPFAFGTPNPSLYDVISGSNGSCTGSRRFPTPSLAYLCTAETGYDGPTGMGTPAGGLAAF